MARKKFDYFEAFTHSAEYAVQYAEGLEEYFAKNMELQEHERKLDSEYSIKRFEELHKLEHTADGVKHRLIAALATEFITPIEREDIVMIAERLDDIIDNLDNVLERIYMYDVTALNQSCLDMARIVTKSVHAVHAATLAFSDFKKHPDSIKPLIIQIGDAEDAGDRLYIQSMHDNFSQASNNSCDLLRAFALGQVLACLENVCDSCEGVADAMTSTILKNS